MCACVCVRAYVGGGGGGVATRTDYELWGSGYCVHTCILIPISVSTLLPLPTLPPLLLPPNSSIQLLLFHLLLILLPLLPCFTHPSNIASMHAVSSLSFPSSPQDVSILSSTLSYLRRSVLSNLQPHYPSSVSSSDHNSVLLSVYLPFSSSSRSPKIHSSSGLARTYSQACHQN